MVENLIEKVTGIVRHATELMKPENVEVTQKGNASNFVTTADINVQQFLKKELLPEETGIRMRVIKNQSMI